MPEKLYYYYTIFLLWYFFFWNFMSKFCNIRAVRLFWNFRNYFSQDSSEIGRLLFGSMRLYCKVNSLTVQTYFIIFQWICPTQSEKGSVEEEEYIRGEEPQVYPSVLQTSHILLPLQRLHLVSTIEVTNRECPSKTYFLFCFESDVHGN